MNAATAAKTGKWNNYQKLVLRFFTVYFLLQLFPAGITRDLDGIHLLSLQFLLRLATYTPQYLPNEGFANWGIPVLAAIALTAVWTASEKGERNYDAIYYWLRLVLRYKLSLGIVAYGLLKIFPLQMPYPSLSNLHTEYGQFLPWKIYFHTFAITQGYESFLGFAEVVSGLLLLYRRTVTIGAALVIGMTGNVVAANFAYDIGEQVFSTYLLAIALFLFAHDVPRLYSLLAEQKYTFANKPKPSFGSKISRLQLTLKSLVTLFILLLAVTVYTNYKSDPYKIPADPGLAGATGFYNVRTFIFNKDTIPYSLTDTNRWQNVVFEKWATISIKTARPVKIDFSKGDNFNASAIDRNYESAGVGGRHYYAYQPDTLRPALYLENKNPKHAGESFTLRYERPSANTIIVRGSNERQDSIYAVLERVDKKHLLFVGRRKPIRL